MLLELKRPRGLYVGLAGVTDRRDVDTPIYSTYSIMKFEGVSDPATYVDPKVGSVEDVPAGEELKRNMKGRHIEMIAIAGMIVSEQEPKLYEQ